MGLAFVSKVCRQVHKDGAEWPCICEQKFEGRCTRMVLDGLAYVSKVCSRCACIIGVMLMNLALNEFQCSGELLYWLAWLCKDCV